MKKNGIRRLFAALTAAAAIMSMSAVNAAGDGSEQPKNTLRLTVSGAEVESDYWTTEFTITNISDKTIKISDFDLTRFAYFRDTGDQITDMMLNYPSSMILKAKWTDGKPDYENQEIFLPVLWVEDEESNYRMKRLEPGESITGYLACDDK